MTRKLAWLRGGALLCLGALLGASGCVPNEAQTSDLIDTYQRAIMARSPHARGEGTLGLLEPVQSGQSQPLRTSTDAAGGTVVSLSLDESVRLAVMNSVEIRVVSFDPAIAREDIYRAMGDFDTVISGGVSQSETDRRSGVTAPSIFTDTDTFQTEIALRKKLITGGEIKWVWDETRTRNSSPFTSPNPQWESVSTLQITQPLLKGAGVDYNLAGIHIAQVGAKSATAQFRQRVEEVVAQTQVNYWSLVQARRDVEIQEELKKRTDETYDRILKRAGAVQDVTNVEASQAKAAVESRKAMLIRAQKNVLDAQDQLARLLSDHRMTLIGKYTILPTTPPIATPVRVDPTDQLVLALKYSPLLEQARLAIDAAAIQVMVAQNETQPSLNLQASVGTQGLRSTVGRATEEMTRFNFIDHSVSAMFEYPIGNTTALAALRQRQFQRLKAITDLQNTADKVAVAVNQAVRQIESSYQEVVAQRAAVEASQAQLKALMGLEELRALSPEFLQVKLQAQDSLATAERALVEAEVNFNNARAQLAQVTGTSLQQRSIRLAMEGSEMLAPASVPASQMERGLPAGK